MINGSWTEELTIVKEAVRGFFLKCFQEPDFARPRLDGSTFKTIHSLQNDMLVVARVAQRQYIRHTQ